MTTKLTEKEREEFYKVKGWTNEEIKRFKDGRLGIPLEWHVELTYIESLLAKKVGEAVIKENLDWVEYFDHELSEENWTDDQRFALQLVIQKMKMWSEGKAPGGM